MLLLLEEGRKSEQEIINESINRFGFPDKEKLGMEIRIQLLINKEYFNRDEDGKYSLSSDYKDIDDREYLLDILKDYPKEKSMGKLKEALEERLNKK
jgi:hypothetical protein